MPWDGWSFPRYLAAKRTVDDRALDRRVWGRMGELIAPARPGARVRVLEAGCGEGAMLERLLADGLDGGAVAPRPLLRGADYTALDADGDNLAALRARLPGWARRWGFEVGEAGGGTLLELSNAGRWTAVRPVHADLFAHLAPGAGGEAPDDGADASPASGAAFDLVVAHAFLDVVDAERAVPLLLAALRPGGLLYAPITFDGVTTFEPPAVPEVDDAVVRLYDAASGGGRPAGRRLPGLLARHGAEVVAAGGSAWVVHPSARGYPADEAYFLHAILHVVEETLRGRPGLDPAGLAAWVAVRRRQVDRGELVYVAHQLDVLARAPAAS